MNTLDIPLIKKHVEYASCMNELTPAHFAEYCRLFIDLKAGKIDVHDFMTQMTCVLLDIRVPYAYKITDARIKEAIESNMAAIMETLGWLLVERVEDYTAHIEPNIDFARNLMPRIGKYKGPDDALQNITLAEFRDAIGHSADFARTNDEHSLDMLCATLYRPVDPLWYERRMHDDWNGDIRKKYNAAKTEAAAKEIHKLPLHLRFGAYLFFNASMNFIRTGTVQIEGKDVSFAVLWEGGNDTPGIGMAGVLFSLAETGVFGTLKEVERVNLYEGLARLYQVVIQTPKPEKKL
jgi:hypothetical protein